jgi:hypothetical protein
VLNTVKHRYLLSKRLQLFHESGGFLRVVPKVRLLTLELKLADTGELFFLVKDSPAAAGVFGEALRSFLSYFPYEFIIPQHQGTENKKPYPKKRPRRG